MPAELPTLGPQPKKSPLGALIVAAVIAGAIGAAIYGWNHRADTTPQAQAPVADPAASPDAPVAAQNVPMPGSPATGNAPSAAQPAVPAVALAADPAVKGFKVTINGPMETAIVDAVGAKVGTPLTQVVNRSLVWWVQVPQELVKGDTLEAVFEERPAQEPLVHAVRFTSRKHGKTYEAYRFQPNGETFARFYDPDGQALELSLVDGPLDTWEQVTSLLRDGRKHKGVDFKAPIGTPVKATFDGVIARKNWNFRGNGNSLELVETGGQGRTALFLHLSEVENGIGPGQRVKRGQTIAKSGNTGRSFAPHLHYQLMRGNQVIDPFESHKTTRSKLEAAELPRLEKEIARLRTLFGAATVTSGAQFGAR